jgi:hypothetical protein
MERNVGLAKKAAKGLGARMLLAFMGGLGALIAGVEGHYHADRSTQGKRSRVSGKRAQAGSKPMGRGRNWTGHYGANLLASMRPVWSAKKSKQNKARRFRTV